MLRLIRIKNNLNDKLSDFDVQIPWQILQNIAIITFEHNLKRSRQMVIFKDKLIWVSNSNWMLCPHNELVRIARVLVIMNDIGDKDTENIMPLQVFTLQIPNRHEVVHRLQWINDMLLVMISILFEVTVVYLVLWKMV